jgi:predicted nucleic acid-binding protein
MIAADTSTWIAFIQGVEGNDVHRLESALKEGTVVLPPAVLTELLSGAFIPERLSKMLATLPLLDVTPDYWRRAGTLRAKVRSTGRKARLGDALIAQSCIDAKVALITRDRDFRAFSEAAGLDLLA